MREAGRGLRGALRLTLMLAAGLFLLEAVPRARACGEASYALSRLREGALLRATSAMTGGPFEGAVVLLVHHDSQGSAGLVVEGRGERDPDRAFRQALGNGHRSRDGRWIFLEAGVPRERLQWGGPADPERAWILATKAVPEIASGWVAVSDRAFLLEVGSPRDALKVLKVLPAAHLVVGRAAWAPGQLAAELRAGAWRLDAGPD